MNRTQLRQLAEDRLLDAAQLLAGGRWAAAYYLAGYAVECGLKACILVRIEATGVIFEEKKFSEECWTHKLAELLRLAGLQGTLAAARATNPTLGDNWDAAAKWKEESRYQQRTQAEAEALYSAIAQDPDGIIPWIRRYY